MKTYKFVIQEAITYYGANILGWFETEDEARAAMDALCAEKGLKIRGRDWKQTHFKGDFHTLVHDVESIGAKEMLAHFDRAVDDSYDTGWEDGTDKGVVRIHDVAYRPSDVLKVLDPVRYQDLFAKHQAHQLEYRTWLVAPDGRMYQRIDRKDW